MLSLSACACIISHTLSLSLYNICLQLEYEFEVQLAGEKVGKAEEMLRKATLELSLPLQPLYKTPIGERVGISHSMFKHMVGRKLTVESHDQRDASYKEQALLAQEGGETVKECLQEKRTVWSMKYGGRVMDLAMSLSSNATMGVLPCFEESIGGCSLVFCAGAIEMIVLEREKFGTKVTGVAKGEGLVIKKASRHLGDTATMVQFKITFDKGRVVKYRGYIDPTTPTLLEGVMLEVASEDVLKTANDIITTKAAYSSALIYMNKGSETAPVVVEIADEGSKNKQENEISTPLLYHCCLLLSTHM